MVQLSKREYNREWRKRNREKCREYHKKYFSKNRDSVNKKHREWYANNKESTAERKRKWRAKNFEAIKIKDAEYRMKKKKIVINHYGGKCVCCGESEIKFMTVDHINGGGNKHRKSIRAGGGDFIRWIINNKFPEGYQTLCYNCNCAKGFYGQCPHKLLSAIV